MSRVAELDAIRVRLTELLAVAPPRDVAALARELRMVLKELDELAGPLKESTVDALAARRAARQQSAAAGS